MTRLDENRAKSELARKAGVEVAAVSNVTIWGNHSATQYPDFHNARITGRPATQVITDEAWLDGQFITSVQQRGAAVIKARNASSAASAAHAITETVRSLTAACRPGRLAQRRPLKNARVLPRSEMWRVMDTTGEQKVLGPQASLLNPLLQHVACRGGDFELHRPVSLVLHDDRTRRHLIAVTDISDFEAHEVAAA